MNRKIIYGLTAGILGYMLYSNLKEKAEVTHKDEENINFSDEDNKEVNEVFEKIELEAHKYNQQLEDKVVELNKKLNQMKGKIDSFKDHLNSLERIE